MKERTYIMIKPDGMRLGLQGEIKDRIKKGGFKIVKEKQFQLDAKILREHYAHMTDKPFYPDIESFMMSGPVLGMIVEGKNAILGMRAIMGPTKDAPKGTIRGDYSENVTKNVIHGSDSVENAEIEIKRFFG